jgi:hypothetical protein
MKIDSFRNVKNSFFILIFILIISAGLRFTQLGVNPLNDSEAGLALSALNQKSGAISELIPQPIYIAITSIFFLFSTSNFTARLLPALLGSLFPILPILFRKWIEERTVILLCVLLTFDPVLISISRQADSRILAISCLVLFIASIVHSRKALAGFFAGLFLLCGIYSWQLSFILFTSILVVNAFSDNKKTLIKIEKVKDALNNKKNILFISCLVFTILIVGSGFLQHPWLINAIVNSLQMAMKSWVGNGFIFNKIGLLLIALLSSYLLYIVMGIAGIYGHVKKLDLKDRCLSIYFVVAFLFFLAKPGSLPVDIFLFIPGFYYFVVKGLLRWIDLIRKNMLESLIIGIPIICLAGFIWLAILRILIIPIGGIDYAQMLIAVIGSVFLLGMIFLLIGWGWSFRAALSGFITGAIVILSLFQLSVSFHSLGLLSKSEQEIWGTGESIIGAELIRDSVEEISLQNAGIREGLDIQIAGVNSPGLIWLLRGHKISRNEKIHVEDNSSFVITNVISDQSLDEKYRGQKIALYAYPGWTQKPDLALDTVDFYRWLFLRNGEVQRTEIEFWARADLFVGNNIKFESRSQ